jgi:taurine dioxygenase
VDLVRFLRTMGELMFTIGETPVAGAPELNVVSNVGGIRPSRSVFHTDTS